MFKYKAILTHISNSKLNKIIMYSVKSFSIVGTSSKSKIITIELDENNNRKIVYKDLKTPDYDSSQPVYSKISNKKKVKIFGSENLNLEEINNIPQANKSANESQNIEKNEDDKEEIFENIIQNTQFYSDYCRIYVKAGAGGNGCYSVLKGNLFDQYTPQGGDGGKGGDVIFIADQTVNSLSYLRRAHFHGNDGERGTVKAQDGRNGKDIEIHLPVGTIINEMIRDEDYKHMKKELRSDRDFKTKLIEDLDEHGKRFVICKGGRKGIGNYTKKNIRQGDKLLKGSNGEERELELILKCIADVGFIGYPNAGKSTLLGAVNIFIHVI